MIASDEKTNLVLFPFFMPDDFFSAGSAKQASIKNNYTLPPFPGNTIGFFHGISPIGTKFQKADLLGPQSQKYPAVVSPISGTLFFDFSH